MVEAVKDVVAVVDDGDFEVASFVFLFSDVIVVK